MKKTTAARASNSVQRTAYDRFQEALLQERLKPGQVVTQRLLVSLLDLSTGALRELLPRLQAEGLLTVLPQRGIQITVIDLPMIRDAFQMRMAMEREAVIVATNSWPQEVIDQQISIHQDIVERQAESPSQTLLDEGQEVDTNFHKRLIEFTKNKLLIQAYDIVSIRIRLIKLERIRLSDAVLPDAFREHLAILNAINKRDQTAAVEQMENHIRNARTRATTL
ncbi:GntR family transcriptional regulator [Pararhizobium sp. IMCC21322]|uniref:GntR family transcriptional regulator n=1 Tax=Pararhizobium sp. IMCC21322 TaxID=3067903 RepID=UPI00274099D6|nr:GntR family transcriptional regulator [Pararhizobium sp. IMCC21322]